MPTDAEKLADSKEGLIDLVEWYRDKYHRSDFCHTEMIEKIKDCQTVDELDLYWQAVDGWLDY